MKKRIRFTICISFIIFLLFGCSDPKYINLEQKPHKAYYTEKLYEIVRTEDFEFTILDTNLYKDATVSKNDKSVLKNTIKSLSVENFIDRPNGLPEKPKYKLFINKDSIKYVIDVYDNNIISLYPWDGNFPEDYIYLKDVPDAYKLESFCKYIYDK